jgi:hypothetical protein
MTANPQHEAPPVEVLGAPDQQPRLLAWQPGRYEWRTAAGQVRLFKVPALPAGLRLSGQWEVRFQAGRGAPERLVFEALGDWSKHPDEGVRHFSGVATYHHEFTVPSELPRKGRRFFLDLGRVEVMAAVKLNGSDLGTLWKAPFRVEVSGLLKRGSNVLEIRVANLWPNRLIGDAALPSDRRLTWTTWNPFRSNTDLFVSGLLGPVTLQTAAVVPE